MLHNLIFTKSLFLKLLLHIYMAANRFATWIHRRTNRITLILVYAFLEWSLIFFIFLNSLFSFFILKFADYFSLKRPCIFCNRLDRFFNASGKSPSLRDLFCDDHAFEISTVQRFDHSLVDDEPLSDDDFGKSCNDLLNRRCCVDEINSSLCAPIEPDLGITDYPMGDEGQIYNGFKFSRSIFVLAEENAGFVNLNDSQERKMEKVSSANTVNEIAPQSPGKIEEEDEVSNYSTYDDDDDDDDDDTDNEFSGYVFDCYKQVTEANEEENKVDLAMEAEIDQATDIYSSEPAAKYLEFYIGNEDCHLFPVEFHKPSEEVREISDINGDFTHDLGFEPDFTAENEETSIFASPDKSKLKDAVTNLGTSTDGSVQMQNDEEEPGTEVSIGTNIPNHEQIGNVPMHELNLNDNDEDVPGKLYIHLIKNIIKKERYLKSPGSLEQSNSLLNSMFHLERRVSGTDSFDGIECFEVVFTVDKLKSELQEERKALKALYEELEEERSASAVAASETMAMINRLHEEKAAMQMEALQYQRMMEEQAEFDQEALQLLNELMVNREKENAELGKELEMCRRRLEEYEAKEKMGILRRRMRDSSVDSHRNNGDLNENNNGELLHNNRDMDWKYKENEMVNTPVDVVFSIDDCLDDYEGERLLILERLKILEEKLKDLSNEEEEEEVKMFDWNGSSSINGNGHIHGKETNGEHRVIKPKRLLPLFNAVDGEIFETGLGRKDHPNGIGESEKGEIATVEEEVDELYERLEALEADRKFLRHCVGSLKKGDKGVHLLNEILQHLRDLRNIDLVDLRENKDMSY